ncbi:nuclear transport factor 2 family protein [Myxococcus stipitatus]|uniref:nuclear transport factor 2 family protein n=1 Tax=Myxococcus stipitatus TaxID=83455 RepID=UPI0030D0E48E
MENPAAVVKAYFDAWSAKDEVKLRGTLAPGVRFEGVLASVEGVEACVQGLVHGMWKVSPHMTVLHRFVDGDEVLTWFEIRPFDKAPVQVANWSHVENGRITHIRVTFDPRSMLEKR